MLTQNLMVVTLDGKPRGYHSWTNGCHGHFEMLMKGHGR